MIFYKLQYLLDDIPSSNISHITFSTERQKKKKAILSSKHLKVSDTG